MNLENIMLTEVKQRQTLYDRAYMWNLKINTNKSICKTETNSKKTNLLLPKGRRRVRGTNYEYGINRYKLL